MQPIVIIGSGLAGFNTVKEFRKLDKETPIVVITSDDGRNYSKPMLSAGFTKEKTADDLCMATPEKVAEQFNVEVRTDVHVAEIDPSGKRVLLPDDHLDYSKLVLALGADTWTPPLEGDATTARSMILVTPDAERTMQTYLGACVELGPEDVPDELIAVSEVIYLEGYLYDPPRAKEAFLKAAKIAEAAGRKVALSLSDSFCVERYRAEFLELVEGHVNILFANEDEITSLYRVDNFDDALQHVRGHCDIAALTRSAKGSVVVAGDEVHVVDAEAMTNLVDTTGAGDSYAAGFLYGLSRGDDLATSARIGGILAAEIISHYGARSATNLAELVAQKLG